MYIFIVWFCIMTVINSSKLEIDGVLMKTCCAVKRGRFDPVSDASNSAEAAACEATAATLDESQTEDVGLLTRCMWDTNCIIGKKIAMRGFAANNASFAWPGIEAVIEAYMQHIRGINVAVLLL